ncbi:phosphatase PAP2 family protein [Methanonatronarchaeum sp. AMET6-2]|uniref:phosphatase PAP2 family protein n=1 Tax=Methanonatronarchaeum sp. AMET6-2 TaxID=2933293 RepID=UPI001FF68E8F|nr:phosphatase PAP2 family protein [Methanonatronarchaeum sp. AMET6-2]UOY09494.1 phosphatase PAP2 family protein [Methanonatronarchaeum sp. AMET6-2]
MDLLNFLFDPEIVGHIVEAIPAWLAYLLLITSYLGSSYIILTTAFIRYLLTQEKDLYWLPILLAGYASFTLIKPLIEIPRPAVGSPFPQEINHELLQVLIEGAIGFTTNSFPSGHAVAVVIFTVLIYRDILKSNRNKMLFIGVAYVISVGFARIGLGTHYFGDIIGGYIIGLILVLSLMYVREKTKDNLEAITLLGIILTTPLLYLKPMEAYLLLSGYTTYYLLHTAASLTNSEVKKTLLARRILK